MAIEVAVEVSKSAGHKVTTEARAMAARVAAKAAALNAEASAAGIDLEITKVDLKHIPSVAPAGEAAPAAEDDGWAGDLTRRSWQP